MKIRLKLLLLGMLFLLPCGPAMVRAGEPPVVVPPGGIAQGYCFAGWAGKIVAFWTGKAPKDCRLEQTHTGGGGTGGGSPGGTGTQLQYRAGASTFGGIAGSSWDGTTLTLTTAAMVVGSGASLSATGTGTIVATSTTGNAATATEAYNAEQPVTNATDPAWGVSVANTATQNQTAFAAIATAVNAGTTPPFIYLPAGSYSVLSSVGTPALGYFTVPVIFHCSNPVTTTITQTGTGELLEFGPSGLTNTSTYLSAPDRFENCGVQGGASSTALTLSAAANASAGTTQYTGTITGGASNAFVGMFFKVAGFDTAANNGGPWECTASSITTVTLQNANGVSDSHAGTATYGAEGVVVDQEIWNAEIRDNYILNYGWASGFWVYEKGDTGLRYDNNVYWTTDGATGHNIMLDYDTAGHGWNITKINHNTDVCTISITNPLTAVCGVGYWLSTGSEVNFGFNFMSGQRPDLRISNYGGTAEPLEIHDNQFECFNSSGAACAEYGTTNGTQTISYLNLVSNLWHFGSGGQYALGAASGGTNTLASSNASNNLTQASNAGFLNGTTGISGTQNIGWTTQPPNFGVDGWLASPSIGNTTLSAGAYENTAGSWVATNTAAAILGLSSSGSFYYYANGSLSVGNTFTPTKHWVGFTSGGFGIGGSVADPGANNLGIQGIVSTYKTVATVGDGLPYNVGHVLSVVFSSTLSGNLLASPAATHDYTVHYTIWQQASGSGGTCTTNATATVAFGWTDYSGTAQSQSFTALNLPPTLAAGATQNGTMSLTTGSSPPAITYTVSWANGNCSTQPQAFFHAWIAADD